MALTDNILSYWKLDNSMTDELGANNGTDSGTADVAGIIGRGRDFERTEGDHIDVGSSTIDMTDGDFTINAWVKIETYATSGLVLGIIGATTLNGYAFYVNHSGYPCFGKAGVNEITCTSTISEGSWAMVSVIYSGSANTVDFYINGSSVNQRAYSTTFSGGLSYMLGSSYDQWFDGVIDEVGVWTRCLGSAEITSLYNSGAGLTYPFTASKNFQINVGVAWKEVTALSVNVGDAWKEVTAASVNVGDAWKTIF